MSASLHFMVSFPAYPFMPNKSSSVGSAEEGLDNIRVAIDVGLIEQVELACCSSFLRAAFLRSLYPLRDPARCTYGQVRLLYRMTPQPQLNRWRILLRAQSGAGPAIVVQSEIARGCGGSVP